MKTVALHLDYSQYVCTELLFLQLIRKISHTRILHKTSCCCSFYCNILFNTSMVFWYGYKSDYCKPYSLYLAHYVILSFFKFALKMVSTFTSQLALLLKKAVFHEELSLVCSVFRLQALPINCSVCAVKLLR